MAAFERLNTRQREAAQAGPEPLLLMAGAGEGLDQQQGGAAVRLLKKK